ncbi:Magnesium transporter NIPA2 [Hondaea fermentalgiana]|uniref:Magnesium transporter NIPA2 n=1 Tax=Hondaea fermentalgiana TaxID=2315210 RepID=A0A2R5H092_9STRA|nr:Magnesium transporter NIPA2 [Hondaea fermentalgiana]|eukprot:GBG34161.1 Magnesium transporter NIPA2 [Hondaea fermentalgiana]
MYLDPLFLFGNFCLTIINTVLNLASMAFADASVTIPFGGLHIVLNVPLAYAINRERSSLRALFLNGLIFVSVVIILVSGNRESTEITARELAGNFFQLSFFVVTMCIVALGLFVRMSMLSPLEKAQRLGMTMGAGLIGALTQLFAKAMSLCLKDGAWESPITYFFILTTIISALCQVYSLNRCLDLFSASFTVPIVNAVIIVVGSLYSAVFFREVERWDTESRIFVPFGIFLCAASIAALSNEPEPTEVREPAMSELSSAAFEEALIDPEATQKKEAHVNTLRIGILQLQYW